jgi:hypothetical protein
MSMNIIQMMKMQMVKKMKIRQGFVSNSSSSSFIVMAENSMEVFRAMTKIVKREYNEEWRGSDSEGWFETHWADHIKEFESSHNKYFNGGIILPFTCNYETYIFPSVDGKCLVETCNNHEWDDLKIVGWEGDSYNHADDDITEFVIIGEPNVVTTAKKYYERPYEG